MKRKNPYTLDKDFDEKEEKEETKETPKEEKKEEVKSLFVIKNYIQTGGLFAGSTDAMKPSGLFNNN